MSSIKGSKQVGSEHLKRTAISAHLEAEIEAGRNLLYCASFQLAWDVLSDDVVRASLELEGAPATAQGLNRRWVGKRDVAEDCYLALAGLGRDGIAERVKQALWEKFKRTPTLEIDLESPEGILAYAYLEKSLPFDVEFEVFDAPLRFSDGVEVAAFGVEGPSNAARQVVILDYEHPDDFVLRLQGDPEVDEMMDWGWEEYNRPRISDQVILAKVAPRTTLRETVEAVLARISERARDALQRGRRPRDLDPGYEVLRIPKIDFDILHRYAELEGKRVLNRGFEGYFISQALQATRFRLDERGADLSSEAEVVMYLGVVEEPRRFIFDGPFLLLLKEERARYPYLAVWIDNSELLVKDECG